jgi:hypothetical protein
MTHFVEFQGVWFKPHRLEMVQVLCDERWRLPTRWYVKLYLCGNDTAVAWFDTKEEAYGTVRKLIKDIETPFRESAT